MQPNELGKFHYQPHQNGSKGDKPTTGPRSSGAQLQCVQKTSIINS